MLLLRLIDYLSLKFCTQIKPFLPPVNLASLLTPTVVQYDETWVSVFEKTSMVISVVACEDAYIALALYPGAVGTEAYELVIGAFQNQYTVLRRTINGNNEVQEDTKDILSCDEGR